MADAIVAWMNQNTVRLGKKTYHTEDKLDAELLEFMRPHLGELKEGETRAGEVANAICLLHEKAMLACLVDEQPLGNYEPIDPVEGLDEVITNCKRALQRKIKNKKQKGKKYHA